jgi:hypothetical protein
MIIGMAIIIAYCVLGIAVGRSIYNITLLKAYEDKFSKLNSENEWTTNWYLKHYNKSSLKEVALHEALSHTVVRESAVMHGIFWLFSGLWYLIYLKSRKMNIQVFPKNVVEKHIDAKKKQIVTEKKLKEAIKLLKAAGMKEEDITIGQLNRIK